MQERNIEESRSLSCPGAETPNLVDKQDGQEILSLADAKLYRRAAAQINYLALDRADFSYASKDVSRGCPSLRVVM